MSYWKGLMIAVAIDLIWIMGCSLVATEPVDAVRVEELNVIGNLEDSFMEHLQEQPTDVDAMAKLADLYMRNGWYEAAIGPLARALQLDPSRRGLWSALDTAIEKSGRAKMTDKELTEKAAGFVEAVEMKRRRSLCRPSPPPLFAAVLFRRRLY